MPWKAVCFICVCVACMTALVCCWLLKPARHEFQKNSIYSDGKILSERVFMIDRETGKATRVLSGGWTEEEDAAIRAKRVAVPQ